MIVSKKSEIAFGVTAFKKLGGKLVSDDTCAARDQNSVA
jgi:hypothetical protein